MSRDIADEVPVTPEIAETPTDGPAASSGKTRSEERKDRLAQALRDNLSRRKQQKRSRKTSGA